MGSRDRRLFTNIVERRVGSGSPGFVWSTERIMQRADQQTGCGAAKFHDGFLCRRNTANSNKVYNQRFSRSMADMISFPAKTVLI